jgi:hypothetical protein
MPSGVRRTQYIKLNHSPQPYASVLLCDKKYMVHVPPPLSPQFPSPTPNAYFLIGAICSLGQLIHMIALLLGDVTISTSTAHITLLSYMLRMSFALLGIAACIEFESRRKYGLRVVRGMWSARLLGFEMVMTGVETCCGVTVRVRFTLRCSRELKAG